MYHHGSVFFFVVHDHVVTVCRIDAQGVEMEELHRVGGAVVAWGKVWLELARPDDVMQLWVNVRQPAALTGVPRMRGARS
jgi:hypothetical protein